MKCFLKRLIYIKKKFLSLFGWMQCCPNKRIYIRALSQHSHKKWKDFLVFLWLWSQELFLRLNEMWNIINYLMEYYLNSLTYIKPFSFFSWIGSSRNKPFSLDFNLKVFIPFLFLVKYTEYNVWNPHWKLTMLCNVVQVDWFTLKRTIFYIQ